MTSNKCEILIYVNKDWHYVRPCIDSVLNRTNNVKYHITLIDDASNPFIAGKLEEYENNNPHLISIVRNNKQMGYTESINNAIKQNDAQFIAVVSTNTCVTNNWLKKILDGFEQDPHIGICIPLTNNANICSLNISKGIDMLRMNSLVENVSSNSYPEIPLAESHVFIFQKKLMDKIGYFNKKIPEFEIALQNFSLQAKKSGFKIVCADNVFIFTAPTKRLMKETVKQSQNTAFQAPKTFYKANNYIPKAIKNKKSYQKIKNVLKNHLQENDYKNKQKYLIFNFNNYKKTLNNKINDILSNDFSKEYLKPKKLIKKETKLNFLCILPTLTPYGGVISVVNMLNHLIEMGHNCSLISLSPCNNHSHIFYGEPIYVADWNEIPGKFAGYHDVFIATSWETVDIIAKLQKKSNYGEMYYFVQDLEETFYDGDLEKKKEVRATYKQIKTKFVKTNYLYQKLSKLTDNVHRIRPGMNLDLFYPHNQLKEDEIVILGMVRYGHRHRGYDLVLEILNKIKQENPEVKIALFGSNELGELSLDFKFVDYGLVKPEQLPRIYSKSSIFLEMSRHHGFGRTGVEAMACGTACVLSDSGGINEYAVDNENAYIVPVEDTKAAVEKISFLINNPEKKSKLISNGLKTVQKFDDRDAAKDFLDIIYETHPLFTKNH